MPMTGPPAEILAEARRLIRDTERATLATLYEGAPFASLVITAPDPAGAPLLLLSDLAEHSKNLRRDPRASLLLDGTLGLEDPLTGPRLTLLGDARKVNEPGLLDGFLARHPAAKLYAGFADFHLYRVMPARAHLVAGFGRIHWLDGPALLA